MPSPIDLSQLNDNIPMLLLPVRVESRFMTIKSIARHSEIDQGNGATYVTDKIEDKKELWVRIFPDDLAYHSHEESLTPEEEAAGKQFWESLMQITDFEQIVTQMIPEWRPLVNSYGQQRAAWIVRTLTPENFGSSTGPPVFPAIQTKAQSWTTTPESHVLPDRFVVRLYRNGTYREITGNLVPDPLTVGFVLSQDNDAYIEQDGTLNFPAEIRWLVDFEEAETVGMGIRISLDATEAAEGFDRLVVLGVKASVSASQGQSRLESLFDGHHYSPTGMALLPQGTPTNQSSSHPSGYSRKGISPEESWALESLGPAFSQETDPLLQSDGQKLANTLGLASHIFHHIHHSDRKDIAEGLLMNKALSSATVGFYLEYMLHPLLSSTEKSQTKTFFEDFVLGRGTIPAFRIGKQPYGILPTTAFSKWAYTDTNEDFYDDLFTNVLSKLETVWSQKAADVKHIGGITSGADTGKEILEILGLHGGSVERYQRGALSKYLMWNLFNFTQQTTGANSSTTSDQVPGFSDNQSNIETWFQTNGISFSPEPFGLKLSFFPRQKLLDGPLIDELPLSEKRNTRNFKDITNTVLRADKNYLGWLSHPSVGLTALKTDNFNTGNYLGTIVTPPTPPRALLYLLLKQSLIVEEIIHGQTSTLTDMKSAMAALKDLPTARLARLLLEHLDCTTYRLDAWMGGLIQQRLEKQRTANSSGIYLGAFSWLEDVRPGNFPGMAVENVSTTANFQILPPGGLTTILQAIIYPSHAFTYLGNDGNALLQENPETNKVEITPRLDPDNQGYIHAPSLSHAVTAAILRSGYQGYKGDEKTADDHPLAVNLNSERVRRALYYLEGVQQGQPIPVLLGHQFEKVLLDTQPNLINLSPYELLIELRKKYPLISRKVVERNHTNPEDDFELRNVIDGLQLLNTWADNTVYWGQDIYDLTDPSEESDSLLIESVIQKLADDMDAIGDLALVEGIYQAIQGKYERAAAFLEAIAGKGLPQHPEVVDTPRQDYLLTHRVGAVMDISAANSTAWSGTATPRSEAEPVLNAWLAQFLPVHESICFKASYSMIEGDPVTTDKYALNALGIQPIDFVYLVGGQKEAGDSTELSQRISDHIRIINQLPDDRPISISYMDTDGLKPTDYSIFELQPIAENLAKVISQSRALNPLDFVLSTDADDVTPIYDFVSLETSLSDALGDSQTPAPGSLRDLSQQITLLLANIAPAVDTYDATTLSAISDLRNELKKLANFGVTEAWPESTSDNSQQTVQSLVDKAASAMGVANDRILTADTIWNNLSTEAPVKATQLHDLGKALFGELFHVFPPFKFANVTELSASFNDPELLDEGGDFAVEEWFQGLSKVRKHIQSFSQIEMLSEAWEMPATTNGWGVAQLPIMGDNQDRWLGIKFPENYPIAANPLSWVLHKSPSFSTTDFHAGFLLDEWVERIPQKELTTGLAMNVDQPNSEAPQSLLLAITPEETGQWEWDDLMDIVNETLDRAKQRGVDPELLKTTGIAQFLPMVLAPVGGESTNPSLDFGKNLVEVGPGHFGPVNPGNALGAPTTPPGQE